MSAADRGAGVWAALPGRARANTSLLVSGSKQLLCRARSPLIFLCRSAVTSRAARARRIKRVAGAASSVWRGSDDQNPKLRQIARGDASVEGKWRVRLFEYRSVRYWSKEINGDTYWGPKKLIFLIRDIDDATMAAAPAESCRFVVLRSPRGRLGSY